MPDAAQFWYYIVDERVVDRQSQVEKHQYEATRTAELADRSALWSNMSAAFLKKLTRDEVAHVIAPRRQADVRRQFVCQPVVVRPPSGCAGRIQMMAGSSNGPAMP